MKLAIIGAGVAGLASARKAEQYNLECTIFEVTGNIGGTWVYTENVSPDEFNNPVRSSLYASLRLNTPTQLMEMEGLEFKPKSGLSYPSHEEMLEYYLNFAKKYNLQQYIKFYNEITKISREGSVWKLAVKDLKQNTNENYLFDAVIPCTGQYSNPKQVQIKGMETFSGDQIHSHFYRRRDQYKGKRLLLVGTGASARDISIECSEIAQKVYLSYHTAPPTVKLREGIEIKGPIASIEGSKVLFEDQTYVHVDSIIYCTGYEYDTSFLDPSCGIEVLKGEIFKPLYKMFINSIHPSMAILGLLRNTVTIKLFELQAEFFMKYLTGKIHLPTTVDMLQSFSEEYDKRSHKRNKYYELKSATKEYYADLAQVADIKPLPLVLWRIWEHAVNCRTNNFETFRNQSIKIIDDEHFEIDDPQGKIL